MSVLLRHQFSNGFFVYFREERKDHPKTNSMLVSDDLRGKLQPISCRQLDFDNYLFANIDSSRRIYKTTAKAQIFKAGLVTAGQTVPPGVQIQGDSFVVASLRHLVWLHVQGTQV
jgi:hypothetical protein